MDITLPVLNLGGAGAQLIVAGTGALVMLIDALWRRGAKRWLGLLALVGLAAALLQLAGRSVAAEATLGGMLAADGLTAAFSVVLIGAGMLSVLLAMDHLAREKLEGGPYYALILFATTGALAMAAAADLIAIFIGLELLSLSLYVLASYARRDPASREAGLKYLLLGAFASAFLLYGMALLYGATGGTRLAEIALAVRAGAGAGTNPLLWAGIALAAVGFGFKLALVPFHNWAPDVYQGAPISVTAFMSVASKAAALAALVRLFTLALAPAAPLIATMLAVLAVLTMTAGNILALVQNEAKRLLAYSSIAQAGYILVAAVALSSAGSSAIVFYLLGYVFTNLGAFAVLTAAQRQGESQVPVAGLAGLGLRQPWLGAALSLFLLSLTGIPLTAGFAGKLYVFGAAVQAGWTWLAVIAVVNSVISAFYYLNLIVIMYMREPDSAAERVRAGFPLAVALLVCAAGVLVLGIVPGPAIAWARQMAALVIG